MTRVPEVQAALDEWREPLSRSGVILLGQDSEASNRLIMQLISGEPPPPLRKLARQSSKFGARTVLLSSPEAYRALRKTRNVRRMTDFAAGHDMGVRVVLVVREQLEQLNALYCRQVMALQTFEDFEPFVTEAMSSGFYHYAEVFRGLLDAEAVDLVAVPFSRLAAADPGRTILSEAGVDAETVAALPPVPSGQQPDDTSGPVLLAASRLLQKRLTRLGRAKVRRPAAYARAIELLRTSAHANGWDDTEFWGWAPELAASTAESFRHGNAEFAAGAWRADWPDPTPARAQTKADLASRSPAVVADVMDTIQRAVEILTVRPDQAAAQQG